MKIFYDTTAMRWGSAGVSTYARHLRKALLALETPPQLIDSAPFWSLPHRGHPLQKVDTALTDLFWRPVLLPIQSALYKADLLHMLYPRPFPLTLHRKPVLSSVNDLYALERPEIFSSWEQHCNRNLGPYLKRLDRIFTISDFTRRELLKFFPDIEASRIYVTPLAHDAERFHPAHESQTADLLHKLGLEKPYFLFVSTLEPRKNVLTLINAFRASGLEQDFDLLLAGGDGWVPAYMQQIQSKIETCPAIRRLGFVSAEDLPLLYSGARAFVYPSHYEGFGIPVLEAMACACPVICSTGSSLDEISGNAALQVDTQTPEALSDALNLLANDDDQVARMKTEGIRQAATFSWKRCAEQTLAVYQDVLGL